MGNLVSNAAKPEMDQQLYRFGQLSSYHNDPTHPLLESLQSDESKHLKRSLGRKSFRKATQLERPLDKAIWYEQVKVGGLESKQALKVASSNLTEFQYQIFKKERDNFQSIDQALLQAKNEISTDGKYAKFEVLFKSSLDAGMNFEQAVDVANKNLAQAPLNFSRLRKLHFSFDLSWQAATQFTTQGVNFTLKILSEISEMMASSSDPVLRDYIEKSPVLNIPENRLIYFLDQAYALQQFAVALAKTDNQDENLRTFAINLFMQSLSFEGAKGYYPEKQHVVRDHAEQFDYQRLARADYGIREHQLPILEAIASEIRSPDSKVYYRGPTKTVDEYHFKLASRFASLEQFETLVDRYNALEQPIRLLYENNTTRLLKDDLSEAELDFYLKVSSDLTEEQFETALSLKSLSFDKQLSVGLASLCSENEIKIIKRALAQGCDFNSIKPEQLLDEAIHFLRAIEDATLDSLLQLENPQA